MVFEEISWGTYQCLVYVGYDQMHFPSDDILHVDIGLVSNHFKSGMPLQDVRYLGYTRDQYGRPVQYVREILP